MRNCPQSNCRWSRPPSDGYGITDKARAYLAPLIHGEDFPPFKDGLPRYVRLKNVAVPKKLSAEFKL